MLTYQPKCVDHACHIGGFSHWRCLQVKHMLDQFLKDIATSAEEFGKVSTADKPINCTLQIMPW
jgi:hypothetical protein